MRACWRGGGTRQTGGPPAKVDDVLQQNGGALGEAGELTLGQRLEALQVQSRAVRCCPLYVADLPKRNDLCGTRGAYDRNSLKERSMHAKCIVDVEHFGFPPAIAPASSLLWCKSA